MDTEYPSCIHCQACPLSALVLEECGSCHPAGAQPERFSLIEEHTRTLATFNRTWLIPTKVAMIHCARIGLTIIDEDELFALGILEVGMVAVGCVGVDLGWFTAVADVLVTDREDL